MHVNAGWYLIGLALLLVLFGHKHSLFGQKQQAQPRRDFAKVAREPQDPEEEDEHASEEEEEEEEGEDESTSDDEEKALGWGHAAPTADVEEDEEEGSGEELQADDHATEIVPAASRYAGLVGRLRRLTAVFGTRDDDDISSRVSCSHSDFVAPPPPSRITAGLKPQRGATDELTAAAQPIDSVSERYLPNILQRIVAKPCNDGPTMELETSGGLRTSTMTAMLEAGKEDESEGESEDATSEGSSESDGGAPSPSAELSDVEDDEQGSMAPISWGNRANGVDDTRSRSGEHVEDQRRAAQEQDSADSEACSDVPHPRVWPSV